MKIVALAMSMICAALLAWSIQQSLGPSVSRYRERYAIETRAKLSEVFLFIHPLQLWWWAGMLSMVFSGLLFAVSGSVVLSILVALVAVQIPNISIRWLRRRRLKKFESQLPAGLLSLASTIRVGIGLSMAFQQVVENSEAPLSQELSLVLREQRLGVSFDTALSNLRARIPSESCSLLVSALQIASYSGGNLAEVCERIASMLRERIRIQGKVQALTAQGRMQAWIAGLLPISLLGILTYIDPEVMSVLWSTDMGWCTLALVGCLELVGMGLIHRIVRVEI